MIYQLNGAFVSKVRKKERLLYSQVNQPKEETRQLERLRVSNHHQDAITNTSRDTPKTPIAILSSYKRSFPADRIITPLVE
jgi:hypothetical protein